MATRATRTAARPGGPVTGESDRIDKTPKSGQEWGEFKGLPPAKESHRKKGISNVERKVRVVGHSGARASCRQRNEHSRKSSLQK